jgi:hypothetical protein
VIAVGLVARLTVVTAGPINARSDPLFQLFYMELNLVIHIVSPAFQFEFFGAQPLGLSGHRPGGLTFRPMLAAVGSLVLFV